LAIPEKPTLPERFILLIPLRYPQAALAWTIILGPIGYLLAQYLQSEPALFDPVNAFIGFLLYFYVFFMIRYLRQRIVRAEPHITPIMTGGESDYHLLFGRLTSGPPTIILGVFLEALALFASTAFTKRGPSFNAPISSTYDVVSQFILILSFATLIWEYCVSSWGLHKLGGSSLKLKSFLEDRFMGARAIGNVSLSVTLVYLGGLLIFFLDSATFLPVVGNYGFEVFFLALLVLGVVMFFLPFE
jgi:hypothetical protein